MRKSDVLSTSSSFSTPDTNLSSITSSASACILSNFSVGFALSSSSIAATSCCCSIFPSRKTISLVSILPAFSSPLTSLSKNSSRLDFRYSYIWLISSSDRSGFSCIYASIYSSTIGRISSLNCSFSSAARAVSRTSIPSMSVSFKLFIF